MDRHTAHLLAAGFRRLLRLADTAEADSRPGVSLGMEVVTTRPAPAVPAEYADLDYCRGCGDMAPDCHCDWLHGVEATDDESDVDAVQAHLESLGVLVVDKTEWALEHCPDLAAEINAVRARNAHTPADL